MTERKSAPKAVYRDVYGAVYGAMYGTMCLLGQEVVSVAVRRDVYGTVDDAMREAANRSIDWAGWAAVDRTHPRLDEFLLRLQEGGR